MGATWTSIHEPLLGTRVELRISTEVGPSAAERTSEAVVSEMRRLQRVFTLFDEASELVRWRTGSLAQPGPELGEVLRLALHWQQRSGGAFNVAGGALSTLWRSAEREGRLPDRNGLAAACARIVDPPYLAHAGGKIEARGDCSGVDLNALAKGWIADRGAAIGIDRAGIDAVVVNAGGDIAHRGAGAVVVGIENPLEPYDNAAPLAVVRLSNGGIATSGSVRRGFEVAGRWFGHVLDARTGMPVDSLVSVTVVAPDAATADVAATVASVLGHSDGLDFVDVLDDVECLMVDPAGRQWCSSGWDAITRAAPVDRS